jgi:hypothetical protein
MAKRKRIKRPKSELKGELKEQISLLKNACDSFDSGFEAIGRHIALSLRVLLHHHGRSKALLEQLGIRNIRFYDTAGPLDPDNLLTECKLVSLKVSSEEGRYMPAVESGGSPIPPKKIRFAEWWNNPVLKDNKGKKFNRRELVQNVANTDGGAHVDPALDKAYMELSRKNSLSWRFVTGNIEEALKGRPELACMRQIAYEVLITLKEKIPDQFN